MKALPPKMLAKVQSGNPISMFYLVDVEYSATTEFHWTTRAGSKTFGTTTYLPGVVRRYDPGILSEEIAESRPPSLELVDNGTLSPLLEANQAAVVTTVWLMFTGIDDERLLDHRGRSLEIAGSANALGGERLVSVDLGSAFASLEQINRRYTTSGDQSYFDVDDTCFDKVGFKFSEIELGWGRA